MSWGYEFIGTKQEVIAKLNAVNPETCGASGPLEKGEAAFVKYHAIALVEALGPGYLPTHTRVRVDAHGSHSWSEVWKETESAYPRPSHADFRLVVERVE